MREDGHDRRVDENVWRPGTITRRRFVGVGAASVAAAGALGAAMLVPSPWRQVYGSEKPIKVGGIQPLTGPAAGGGLMAKVGQEVAAERINAAGGVNGRPIELIVEDSEGKPAAGIRKTRKLLTRDLIDVGQGGFMSNVCIACMPEYRRARIVNMIGVCLDTTITTSRCDRYTFRPFDYAPAQAVAFAPYLVNNIGKKWHILFADYAWGQTTRDAYRVGIENLGGEVVGTTGIPLGTADMVPFLSRIRGDFDGLFMIFFGKDGVNVVTQAYNLGLHNKYRFAGDGAAVVAGTNLPAQREKALGFVGIDRYLPIFEGPLDTEHHQKFFNAVFEHSKKYDPNGILPDRYSQSNFEALNVLKVGMEACDFRGREDTEKLVEALEDLQVYAGDDFPTVDRLLRKADHQAFTNEYIFEVVQGAGDTYQPKVLQVVPWQDTIVPPACQFA
jgi:branched-chain amino acid transport system substrate-binding protein